MGHIASPQAIAPTAGRCFIPIAIHRSLVGIPGKVIEGDITRAARHDVMELDHAKVPDPVARAMGNLIEKLNKMSVRMEEIEERSAGRGSLGRARFRRRLHMPWRSRLCRRRRRSGGLMRS